VLFVLGQPQAVGECLEQTQFPDFAYAAYFADQADVVNKRYELMRVISMLRMVMHRMNFAGASPAANGSRPSILEPQHLDQLEELYRYDVNFRPDMHQYSRGRYMGIFDGGELLAAAGTHFLSYEHSFAMIGNIYTREDHRREGLARRTVSGLLTRLFETVDTVCLNVSEENTAAVNLYASMGFTTHCGYREGAAFRRNSHVEAVSRLSRAF
jgi:ribosomal protein S18 acetylase RimI-like enzyme